MGEAAARAASPERKRVLKSMMVDEMVLFFVYAGESKIEQYQIGPFSL